MFKEKKPNLLISSRIAVIFGVVIMFVLGLVQIMQGFIDTHNYREEIIKIVKEQTGREVTIKGTVSIALLPFPTLYIPGIELRDPDSDKPAPAATVDLVSIRVPIASIFSERPEISSITLEHPVLELVRAEDNFIHWEWLNTTLLKSVAGANDGDALAVNIVGGRITYHDNRTDKGMTVDDIAVHAVNGKRLDMSGSFMMYGHDLNFTALTDSNAARAAGQSAPLNFKMTSSDGSSVALDGTLDLAGDLPEIKGKMSLDLDNALTWVEEKSEEGQHVLQQITNKSTKEQASETKFPVKLTCDWAQLGLGIDMTNLQFQGLGSSAAGNLKLSWNEWHPTVKSELLFSMFNFDDWRTFAEVAFAKEEVSSGFSGYKANDSGQNPLPQDFQISLNLKADQLQMEQQVWKNARLSTDMADGAVTVNQFNVDLPGDSTLTLFGIISKAPTSDLRFEGSMETEGKSLRSALTVFDESALDLPETGFGNFSARSNIFVSSEQLRLSEADVKLSDLHLNGGLVAYFDTNPRLEADVKLKDINFDYFRDAWRDKQKQTGKEDFFLKFDKSLSFSWLRKLQTTVDFKVGVDKFTFLERGGESASFRLYAKQGELGVYNVVFNYPNDVMKGSFKLDVNGEKPAINLVLSAGEINTNYFSLASNDSQMVPIIPTVGVDEKPADPVKLDTPEAKETAPAESAPQLEVVPQAETITVAQEEESGPAPARPAATIDDIMQPRTDAKGNPTQKRWSEALLDMSWLEGFSGVMDVNIGRLVHKDIALQNVHLQATFQDALMTFKAFTFSYWQGQCSMLGSIYGGNVPGFSLSFVVTDADIKDMLKSLTGRQNITGRVSISSSMSTSGVNYLSWISQAEAKVAFAARGVTVQGFNLQGVSDAVSVSRTASDVFNSVNLALVNGATTFDMDGNLNIKNGSIKTPGINLRSESVLGNLMGEVKLVPWTLELSTLYQFPAMSTETTPTMTVQLSGPLDNVVMNTDTSSLEAYVAKRITSK